MRRYFSPLLVAILFTSGCFQSQDFAPTTGKQALEENHVKEQQDKTDDQPNQNQNTDNSNNWNHFRGNDLQAVAENARGLPTEWSDEKNVVWKTPLPGAGTSSPVIYGDRVFLTCHTGYGLNQDSPGNMDDLERFVLCIDRKNGKILRKKKIESFLPESEYRSRMLWHGYASSTPAVDAERVYCFFGKSGVVALDHDGKHLWTEKVGDKHHGWGSATSPVLYKDLVIVNAFVESGDLVALNKNTGKVVWRLSGLKESWNTPILVKTENGQTELAVGIFGEIWGVDPDNGKRLWECKGPNWYIVGTMACHDGVIYCTAGSQYETVAVKAGGRGDVTESHLIWKARKGSNVSSPVVYNGHVYFAHENRGTAYCLNAKSGEVVYEERFPRGMSEMYSSPIIADGKIYYLARNGVAAVVKVGPQFEVLSLNRFESDRSIFNAVPAISHNQIFLRSNRFLYCLGKQ